MHSKPRLKSASGVGVSIGSHSCTAALKTYGNIKRIAILSPYYPVANEQVRRYFTDSGFEVVRDVYLQCKSWTAIAEVTTDVLREQLILLDGNGHDVDAIVQVGTNLSMVRLAAAAELWLGKPVIAINTATYWHALRQNKIMDKIAGLGPPARGVLNADRRREPPGIALPGTHFSIRKGGLVKILSHTQKECIASFSADWLAMREPYDVRARNPVVLDAVVGSLNGASSKRIVDLASGTGSTLRALAPRLPVHQIWQLVDNDVGLLARASASVQSRRRHGRGGCT